MRAAVFPKENGAEVRDIIGSVAAFHSAFEQIHPSSDGNGRFGRLLLHAQLLTADYPPALIRPQRRRAYYAALNRAQRTADATRLEDLLCTAVLAGRRIVQRKEGRASA